MTGNDMTNNPQAASDEKIRKAALEAGSIEAYTSGGIRRDFSFHEAQLRRFAALITDPLKVEIAKLNEVIAALVEVLSRYTTTNLDHNINCPLSFESGGTRRDSKCECGVDELDAAVDAALSAAQALDKKEW